ncbi:hypothetical protein X560_2719 [Listeria fleischmannii 1991]|uniref:Uncharacterized protein n=1 Tax=Listeria fleischmannii 1991 TaxID=1430899 RepID=A0A0J8J069_9LIST|nr:hypothetical protein X560_2719 [Listeria fleischmannii 1991]
MLISFINQRETSMLSFFISWLGLGVAGFKQFLIALINILL